MNIKLVIINIIFLLFMNKKNKKVVILCGGKGIKTC